MVVKMLNKCERTDELSEKSNIEEKMNLSKLKNTIIKKKKKKKKPSRNQQQIR